MKTSFQNFIKTSSVINNLDIELLPGDLIELAFKETGLPVKGKFLYEDSDCIILIPFLEGNQEQQDSVLEEFAKTNEGVYPEYTIYFKKYLKRITKFKKYAKKKTENRDQDSVNNSN